VRACVCVKVCICKCIGVCVCVCVCALGAGCGDCIRGFFFQVSVRMGGSVRDEGHP
jgi:hypothetical protein